jgi:hypothetical protein
MIQVDADVQLHYVGPDLSEGPLPALFYFALSAEESLYIDPYNQPVVFLKPYPLRIFSIDLPAHGPGLASVDAMPIWVQELSSGNDIIGAFLGKIARALEYLIQKNIAVQDQIGVMGLSRGGFISAHVAARHPFIRSILGFAPLTKFSGEFEHAGPLIDALALHHLTPSLADRALRFYIGNRDVRVGTAHCFHFITALAEAAFHQKISSSPIELLVGPSIGHRGHGTPKDVFESGALWMAKQLGVFHEA